MTAVLPAEPPDFDPNRVANKWRKKLFNPPCASLERALDVPDPPDRAPKGLAPGAWRAWREAQQVELAREHWENLATRGLVPAEWLGDEGRAFLGTRAVHRPDLGGSSTTYESALFAHPPTPDAAILLASDMANVLAVEQLAREAWRRARRFDPTSDTPAEAPRVLWSLSSKSPAPPYELWSIVRFEPTLLAETLVASFFERDEWLSDEVDRPDVEAETGDDPARAAWLVAAIYAERLQGLFARARQLDLPWRGAFYEDTRTADEAGLFASFGEIEASPYEPVLEILRRGYGYCGFDRARGGLRIEGVYG